MLILDLLDLLETETDENHRLSQKRIAEILSSRYGDEADRKTIRRNLMMLSDAGFDISHSERNRKDKNGEEEAVSSEWYYNHDFTDAELRLLIDSLLFSKAIPYSQCKDLIGKLRGLSSRYFNARVSYIRNLPENQPVNRQLFYTIDVLDEAIGKKKQVAFNYCEYRTDLKMHRKQNAEGEVREYVINPYQIVATNGRYYLICNYDKYDNVSYYRLERITDIRLLDSPVKPLRSLRGYENGIDLPTHMAEHIYMMSGESSRVKFRADQCIVTEIIDWFGKDVKFSDETDDAVTVTVKVNEKAMFYWLMQYGEYVEVLEPKTLRKRVQDTAQQISEKYRDQSGNISDICRRILDSDDGIWVLYGDMESRRRFIKDLSGTADQGGISHKLINTQDIIENYVGMIRKGKMPVMMPEEKLIIINDFELCEGKEATQKGIIKMIENASARPIRWVILADISSDREALKNGIGDLSRVTITDIKE